jgi:hypothetical protein
MFDLLIELFRDVRPLDVVGGVGDEGEQKLIFLCN